MDLKSARGFAKERHVIERTYSEADADLQQRITSHLPETESPERLDPQERLQALGQRALALPNSDRWDDFDGSYNRYSSVWRGVFPVAANAPNRRLSLLLRTDYVQNTENQPSVSSITATWRLEGHPISLASPSLVISEEKVARHPDYTDLERQFGLLEESIAVAEDAMAYPNALQTS